MIFPTELDEERSEEHILLMGLRTPFNERRWSQFSSINSLFNDKDPSKSVAVVPVLPEAKEESLESIKLCQKLEAISYKDIDEFAKLFVDEIIDISVGVCKNVKIVIDGSGEDYSKEGDEDETVVDIPEPDLEISEEDDFFPGWPIIAQFNVDLAILRIEQFMSNWRRKEAWTYSVFHEASWSDYLSDFHLFKGVWSIPSKEYPIAQATASIFFTIEVSRVKPKFCFVNVTLQFEGSSSVYKAGQFEFIEQWLFNIIDSKLNLFRTLKF